jgi:hypothetical protein
MPPTGCEFRVLIPSHAKRTLKKNTSNAAGVFHYQPKCFHKMQNVHKKILLPLRQSGHTKEAITQEEGP